MNENDLQVLKQLQLVYLNNKEANFDTVHPWRKNWKYTILHSYRVEKYVETILEKEKIEISTDDILLTRAAAIIHDIGKLEAKSEHAIESARIVQTFINNGLLENLTHDEHDRLIYMLLKHSEKANREKSNYCLNVLKDADLLDETGMMSIFMAGNWVDRCNPYYFNELHKRIEQKEIEFCYKGIELLFTETAKNLLIQKKEFIKNASDQLKEEIMGINDI